MRLIQARLAGVLAFGVIAASFVACSHDGELVQAADAPIGIETSQLFVTVQNKAGIALLDLTVTVQTPGAPYTYVLSRLESGDKRDVPLSSFSSRDGTSLSLRMVRPRAVQVTATDMVKKKYDVKAPWK